PTISAPPASPDHIGEACSRDGAILQQLSWVVGISSQQLSLDWWAINWAMNQ
ncbi:unnamed protein product, partial [Polarella glacialis]